MRVVKEYCCCAIPLINAGIYITLTEQFVVALTAGVLALATPPLVGTSIPSFAPTLFAVLCFVAVVIQLLGFYGVFRESTIIFRRYTTLHSMIIIVIFAYSAAFIGLSAANHNAAASKCITTFFPPDPSAQATALTGSDSEGKLLCNIFTWIGVGTLAGLWAVLGIFHLYLFFVISGYGSSQRDDHSKYYALYSLNSYPGPASEAHPSFLPPDNIGMRNLGGHGEPWDTRDSMDTIAFEKQDPFSKVEYPTASASYPQQGQLSTTYPDAVRTMSPAPTPAQMNYQDQYYDNTGLDRPDPSVRHPAEGSFHRKTPRMTPAPQVQPYSSGPYLD